MVGSPPPGGVDVDWHTGSGVGRGSSGRLIWQWLGGASPYDRDGSHGTPHYTGFNTCYIDKINSNPLPPYLDTLLLQWLLTKLWFGHHYPSHVRVRMTWSFPRMTQTLTVNPVLLKDMCHIQVLGMTLNIFKVEWGMGYLRRGKFIRDYSGEREV